MNKLARNFSNAQFKLTQLNTFDTKYSNLEKYTFSTAVIKIRNSIIFSLTVSGTQNSIL